MCKMAFIIIKSVDLYTESFHSEPLQFNEMATRSILFKFYPLFLHFFLPFPFLFETGSHYIALTALELIMLARLASGSQICLPKFLEC